MFTVNGTTYYEMADAITPDNLPPGKDAYLGYVDGRWPDYQAIAQREGGRPCYGLTVFGNPQIGDGTDSEPGNATIDQTVTATKGELARGVDRPIVYCPASWAAQMVDAHSSGGVDRSRYRLLTAHYQWPQTLPGFQPGQHFCGPATCGYGPGSNGTQWWNGPAFDLSILDPPFITAAAHPGPPAVSPTFPCTIGGQPAMMLPFNPDANGNPQLFETDAAGWFAGEIVLPAGKTKNDIVSIPCDAASVYDGSWHLCV